ncbi:MAG TPA: SagB/ThcOx family dehydrogenase [Microthrixaceae bacterium]|nr:SagB/ThcOx family dehydrogenase [Sorangium sp.]HTO01695.1 SagB/ThcOx family dehydrogenase [Microthrixaceae bacterium]
MTDDKTNTGKPSLLSAAAYINSFKGIDPWAEATAFRSHPFRFRTLGNGTGERTAEQFLLNSRLQPNQRATETSIESYFHDIGVSLLARVGKGRACGAATHPLPDGAPLTMKLDAVLANRRSHRAYTGDPMPLASLAAVLRAAAGVTALAEVPLMQEGTATLRFRAAPSGGGLYPVDLLFASLAVDGLEKKLFEYDPVGDQLVVRGSEEAVKGVLSSFSVPDEVIALSDAALIILLVGQPWRAMRKYGDRGVRLMLLEAGAISAHINLAVTSLGFGSVDSASIYDTSAHEAIEFDGLYRTLLHTIVIGCAG